MNTGQSEKFALELRLFSELHKLGCPAFKRAFCLGVRTLDPQANIGPMRCEKHPDTELVCPACAGVRGGQARANKLSWDQRVRSRVSADWQRGDGARDGARSSRAVSCD